jgi:hypothetical protein
MTIKDGMKLGLGIILVNLGVNLLMYAIRVLLMVLGR